MNQFKKEELTSKITIDGKTFTFFSLKKLEEMFLSDFSKLPYTFKILLENIIRNYDGKTFSMEHIENIIYWKSKNDKKEISFKPGRIVLQDFTGTPCLVSMASMRSMTY